MRKILSLLFLFFTMQALAQTEACNLRITLLTCSPGEELYATFGHTAVRVQDPLSGTDEVFNYGMFEFGPDFYPKFVRGKLLYVLGVESFPDFLSTYQYEQRSVVEQDLLLPCTQKEALWAALRQNARPENRAYRYDFLFDNCTTRAQQMILRYAGAPVQLAVIVPPTPPTFRNLLHTYLDRGGQHWSKLGIDLLLGARLDRRVSNEEAMFLPDNLMKALNGTRIGGKPLATAPQPVLQMRPSFNKSSLFRPAVVFAVLLLVIGLLSFSKQSGVQQALRLFDKIFFFLLGMIGVLLLFMWFGTDHRVCRDNLNLLWALPTHAVAAFYAGRQTDRTLTYFRAVCVITGLLLASWALLPQQLNPAFIPLLLLIMLRSWHLSKTKKYGNMATGRRW